jgi:hypothetical protein
VGATDNLNSLHVHEEELRVQSLSAIGSNADLTAHWELVAEAMNAIYAFAHDHVHSNDNELTLQYLGIRLFNAAGAAINLALSGYYQKAFDQLRDIVETYFLVDYLSTYPLKIAEWKTAEKRRRIAEFGPGKIRNELDKRDGYVSGERKKIYDLMSEYASHASFPGIVLTTTGPGKMARVGPFYDEQKLSMWLVEIAMRISHAAVILVSNAEGRDLALLATRQHYLSVVNAWWRKYRGMTPQATP